MITTAPTPTTTVEETAVDSPSATSSEQASDGAPERSNAEINDMIEVAAYYIAQRRGFEPGHEIDDWLPAQAQVFDQLAQLDG